MARPRFGSGRSTRTLEAVLPLLVLFGGAGVAPAEVGARTGPIASADFSYVGAFRLECGGDWCSYNLDGAGLVFADGFESGNTSAWSF